MWARSQFTKKNHSNKNSSDKKFLPTKIKQIAVLELLLGEYNIEMEFYFRVTYPACIIILTLP